MELSLLILLQFIFTVQRLVWQMHDPVNYKDALNNVRVIQAVAHTANPSQVPWNLQHACTFVIGVLLNGLICLPKTAALQSPLGAWAEFILCFELLRQSKQNSFP